MLARRTASAVVSCRSAAPLGQFHTSSVDEDERAPVPITPTAQSIEREAKMKEYIARQAQAQMPYTGEWQPQAAQYSGMAQRQPKPQQRQPMQFPRLAGGVQPDMPQREPQMMRGPAGMWPQGYQPQVPRQRLQQPQQFGQQQNGQQQAGVYKRRFGQEQYLQQQRQREPGSELVIRKHWVESGQQPFQQQPPIGGQMPMGKQTAGQPGQQPLQQFPPMERQAPMGQQGTGQPGQQRLQQYAPIRRQMPMGQRTARQPGQQPLPQFPPMERQIPMGQQTAGQPGQQPLQQYASIERQMPLGQQTAGQPGQQRLQQYAPMERQVPIPAMERQIPMGQQTTEQPGQQQFQKYTPMVPMGQQTAGQPGQQPLQQYPPVEGQLQPRGSRPLITMQPGGFRLHKYLSNHPGTSAWAEAALTQPTTPGVPKISHFGVSTLPQDAPGIPSYFGANTPPQGAPGPKISHFGVNTPPQSAPGEFYPGRAPATQQHTQPQVTIPDAPPTRESGSFSFNSAPVFTTPTGLSGPRAVRRAGTTRRRAEDWNKPRPATTAGPATPAGSTTPLRRGINRKDKDLEEPPKLQSVIYTPLPPTPESLFPDIPSTLLSPLGQSKILTDALPTFHKPQSTWSPEDWEKYDAKRQGIKQKWIDGRRYEWNWAGEGGVDGVQNGGQALDSVRRLVSLNPSYDIKGKRVIMGMLWDRLPHPVIAPPKKVLMLEQGKAREGEREREVRP